MSEALTILGIDPGSRVLGWGAVLWRGPQKIALREFGAIRVTPGLAGGERLLEIRARISEVFARVAPDAVAIEKVFYGRNFQSALTIGEARGVCVLAASEAGYPLFSYAAAEIKAAVTGNGRAHKSQVAAMVARILGLAKPPAPADAADALACALCHTNRMPFRASR
jgi:crossover junction endodeoxyribonuclease RuvC